MKLGTVLKVYRERNDDNKTKHDPIRNGLREMAAEIGISPTTLSRIEKGGEPDAKTLRLIWAWLTYPESEAA